MVLAFGLPPADAQEPASPVAQPHVWLDRAGQPLPFQTNREILDYLSTAEVVDRSPIGEGTTGAERLVLDRGGVRVRAAFRVVDEKYRGPFEGLPRALHRVRDQAVFECAAYELSEALGFDRVPPTVCRRIGKTDGSVQIWLEGSRMQDDFLDQSPHPPDVEQWNLQKHRMYVFDALIANLDRNQGNILVDREGTLWFIDHTRTFAQYSHLLQPDKVTRCSRDLWRALNDFDEEAVGKLLEPYLQKREIEALFKRRTELVERISKLIAADGEDAVLFDFELPRSPTGDTRPPATTSGK